MARFSHSTPCGVSGLSLVELMVAMAVGLVLVAGLVTLFSNSITAYSDMEKTTQQIENGRYAIDLITQDLHHAGFYGQFAGTLPAPGAFPDPCVAAPTAAGLFADMALPVQSYNAPTFTTAPALPANCTASLLTAANVVPGSDILVIRRADTAVTTVPVLNEVYLQANTKAVANEVYEQVNPPVAVAIQFGNPAGFALGSLDAGNGVSTVGTGASGGGVNATILKKANNAGAAPANPDPRLAADIRKYHLLVYFVAPCSVPAGGGNVCTGATDDGGQPIPTLKRLDLTAGPTMTIVPLVEGIDRLQVDYGIDANPATVNAATGSIGDGVPDSWAADPTLAQWSNVVAARVHVVARTTRPTAGYTDTKTYAMGLAGTTTAAGDRYKRHVFTAMTRLTNPGGRREVPQ